LQGGAGEVVPPGGDFRVRGSRSELSFEPLPRLGAFGYCQLWFQLGMLAVERSSPWTTVIAAVLERADLSAVADRAQAVLQPFDLSSVAAVGGVEPAEFAWDGAVPVPRLPQVGGLGVELLSVPIRGHLRPVVRDEKVGQPRRQRSRVFRGTS
jgi:hypothetical protein